MLLPAKFQRRPYARRVVREEDECGQLRAREDGLKFLLRGRALAGGGGVLRVAREIFQAYTAKSDQSDHKSERAGLRPLKIHTLTHRDRERSQETNIHGQLGELQVDALQAGAVDEERDDVFEECVGGAEAAGHQRQQHPPAEEALHSRIHRQLLQHLAVKLVAKVLQPISTQNGQNIWKLSGQK